MDIRCELRALPPNAGGLQLTRPPCRRAASRSFFKKPGGANAAAKAEGGAAAQAATPKAEPAALPAAAAASPAATAAAASARKRQLAEEPREVVDLTSEGEEVAPADKRARVGLCPSNFRRVNSSSRASSSRSAAGGRQAHVHAGGCAAAARQEANSRRQEDASRQESPIPAPPVRVGVCCRALLTFALGRLRDESELEFSARLAFPPKVRLPLTSPTQVLADAKWGGADRQAAAPPPSLADLPRGPDDCLEGLTFVLTGALPHLGRCAAPARKTGRAGAHPPRQGRRGEPYQAPRRSYHAGSELKDLLPAGAELCLLHKENIKKRKSRRWALTLAPPSTARRRS